jgi:hypothetical protein
LYINAKISIRPMWEDMFNIAKTQQIKIIWTHYKKKN